MARKTSKAYKHYRLQSKDSEGITMKEIKEILKGGKELTPDRSYMIEQFQKHIDFFESIKVEMLKDLVQLLHDYGCRTENQRKIIEGFIVFMKENKNIDIFLLKPRELKKANAGERNILMNRLAIEYQNDFVSYIKSFLYQKYPENPKTEEVVQEIQAIANQLTVNSALISQVTSPVLNNQDSLDLALNNQDSFNSFGFVDENPLDNFYDQLDVFTECFNESYDSFFDGISIMEDARFNI